MNLNQLTQQQKIFAAIGVVVFVGIVIFLVWYFIIKKDTPKATPKATPTPTNTPTRTNTPTPTNTPVVALKEVYYADKGGTNETRYAFGSKDQADTHAKLLGGTLATLQQLIDAHSKGLDVCSFAWASDGLVYTVSQNSHGLGSGCENNSTIGVKTFQINKGGAWVYGVKPPAAIVTMCNGPSVTTPCILPFSTVTKKWSQYS